MKVPTAGLVFLETSALLTAASRGRCSKMRSNSLSLSVCTQFSHAGMLKGSLILSAPTLP